MIDVASVNNSPGGGAEVFSERVRKALFPFKIGAPKWLEVHLHRARARASVKFHDALRPHGNHRASASTHITKLRGSAVTKRAAFFRSFRLAYQPGTTQVVKRQASVMDDLKTIAVSAQLKSMDNF